MDDLGAEYLSELSTSCGTNPNHPKKTKQIDLIKEQHSDVPTITPILEDLSLDSDSSGKEKTDATPENIKKIDDVIIITSNTNEVNNPPPSTTDVTGVSTIDDSSIAQQKPSMAFTIDFGGGSIDNNLTEQQAAKYKNMVERFQNRHKRGSSMSKLESSGESSQSAATVPSPPQPTTTAAKVKMRIRERSTSGVRSDSNNRHSWSPRSSTHETTAALPTPPTPTPRINSKNPVNLQKSLPSKKPLPFQRKKEGAFTPKSLAMQKAMEKFEFYLPEPPLINGKRFVEGDGISEAGTYTLDGDNYTEEQKELMNIDDEHPNEPISIEYRREPSDVRKKNILEVSYFKDSTTVIPDKKPQKTSYLEKIKTRVRANFKSSSTDKDCGTFTSITTSGVLAKRSLLSSAPAGGRRKHSLSKSQIDSSEYITRERGLTDHQKSEYRLNLFANQTDSQLLSSLESDVSSLKTAQTKNDWIQEWARNARARSVATDVSCSYSNDYDYSNSDPNLAKLMSPRPPKSPTKIPSPMHTTRFANRARASLQNLIGIELSDTEDPSLYLEKTKMLINNLQENLSRRNSLKSTNTSPKKSAHTTPGISLEHKRNLSLDYNIPSRNQSHHQISPRTNRPIPKQHKYIDQTTSPLRRSCSFSVKPLSASSSSMVTPNSRRMYQPQAPAPVRRGVPLQKSASSNSFRKMYSDYDDNVEYYINDEDDLNDNDYYSSDEEEFGAASGDYYDDEEIEMEQLENDRPSSNTPRYNKVLLMRIEKSKQKIQQQPPPTSATLGGCRNTPEMPRRNVNSAGIRSSMRQSMPRDTSLNRLKNETNCIPNSLASAKKQLLQTANNNARIQPKYMDISKYKPAQSANFLRKNESKSTLKPEIKRSPSNMSSTAASSSGFSRGDLARVSNRSVKSAGYKPSLQGNNNRMRDSSVSKQKEAELEMWKRRAKYDPMKAAAEDKRKKEEAKRISQGKSSSESSSVARSQSFHYGIGSISNDAGLRVKNQFLRTQQSIDNQTWIESSDEYEDDALISSSTNRS